MNDLAIATLAAALILVAAIFSVELAISSAIIEIALGVLAGNFANVTTTPWIDFIASFAGVLLTFLAGAEVDPKVLRERPKQALAIGGLSFFVPFVATGLFAYFAAGWNFKQSEIAGIALSTTSLAVVYAVLVETGLTKTAVGKLIMAATFITDLGTVTALSALFITPTPYLALFVVVSIGVIAAMVLLERPFFRRYGDRVIEPEIKGAFFALFLLMWTANLAHSQAVLPAFLLGLAVAPVFQRNPEQHKRMRVVAFAFLTPFFFLKGGLNLTLHALSGGLLLLGGFFVLKIAAKFAGVLPVAMLCARPHAMYTTLLMSTGLTFGTIASLYGLNSGIIDRAQFSILITAVILSAIIPTIVAQRFFSPPVHKLTSEEELEVEDEEFAPSHGSTPIPS
ncbi:MAG: cation:proton antiporter [Candidatus Dormibacteraceae bacterium]